MKVDVSFLCPCRAIAHIYSCSGVSLSLEATFTPRFDCSGYYVDLSYCYSNERVVLHSIFYGDNLIDVFQDFINSGPFSMINDVTGTDEDFIIDELVVYYGVVS